MTTTSAHIWQSSETYRWNTGDVLGRGATAVVYKARNLVRYYTYMYTNKLSYIYKAKNLVYLKCSIMLTQNQELSAEVINPNQNSKPGK